MKYEIIKGDVLDVIPTFKPEHFSAVICDPPYHLTQRSGSKVGFMGQKWDGGDVAFRQETWQAVMRVLKPGSFMMAFGGTRTYHRLVCAIEDSGMEIRDALTWLYADSRPPNLDISKAIDKEKGLERKIVGKYQPPGMTGEWNLKNAKDERTVNTFASSRNNLDITAPESLEANLFDGYGTALKPSCELINLSMKPTNGNFVDNALSMGISGLNINSARLPLQNESPLSGGSGGMFSNIRDGKPYAADNGYIPSPFGRWPKNVLLDQSASQLLGKNFRGANRFFYCNKVSSKERNEGLPKNIMNDHQTLKPIMLTTYLASLMLPPKQDGIVRRILVPFCGVGSEMIGAVLAGWDEVIGIENGGGDDEVGEHHCSIAKARLQYWTEKHESKKEDLFTF